MPSTFVRYSSCGLLSSQAVVCRNVKQRLATGNSVLERAAVVKIADDSLYLETLQVAAVRIRPHQCSDLPALPQQSPRDRRTYEARCAGDQRSHRAAGALRAARVRPEREGPRGQMTRTCNHRESAVRRQ